MNNNLVKIAVLQSLGVVAYTTIVALLMTNGDKVFGQINTVLAGVAFLMFFILSVAIVGSLIVVKPLMLYLDAKKKEAIELLLYTISTLFIFTLIFLFILWLIK